VSNGQNEARGPPQFRRAFERWFPDMFFGRALALLRAGNQDRGWKLSRYIFGQFGCIKGTYNATELPLLLKREEACGDYNKSAAPAKLANVTAFCERQFSRRQSCPAAASLLRGSSNCVLARFCFSMSLLKTSASCSRQCSVKQSVEQNILRGLLGLKSPGTKRFVQFDLKHFLNG
jgi:hypothetical protein